MRKYTHKSVKNALKILNDSLVVLRCNKLINTDMWIGLDKHTGSGEFYIKLEFDTVEETNKACEILNKDGYDFQVDNSYRLSIDLSIALSN